MGLDVSVTNALGMDISQAAKQLVHVHLRTRQQKNNKRNELCATANKQKDNVVLCVTVLEEQINEKKTVTFTYMIGMMLLALLKCLATL